MVEVVTQPTHLAGAVVENVRKDETGTWLILDQRGSGGNQIVVGSDYVKTAHVSVFLAPVLKNAARLEPEARAAATFNTLVEEDALATLAIDGGLAATWFGSVELKALMARLGEIEDGTQNGSILGRRKTLRELGADVTTASVEGMTRGTLWLSALVAQLSWNKANAEEGNWTPRLEAMLIRATREEKEAIGLFGGGSVNVQ